MTNLQLAHRIVEALDYDLYKDMVEDDSDGCSFADIAEMIEEQYPKDTLQRMAVIVDCYLLLMFKAGNRKYHLGDQLVTRLHKAIEALTPEDLQHIERLAKGECQ